MDLLWEPKRETLKNPDRFVLMFAPISRTYSTAYADAPINESETLPPYTRNKITLPREVSANVGRLKKWQKKIPGCDSFIFDYHYMWDHYKDPGYMDIARVMFKDMKNLDKLGLNGMVSCQTQRAFFPSGIGMAMMAEALWNKDADFESAAEAYFKAAYGEDGPLALDYLNKLSVLFDPPYIRCEKPQIDAQKQKDYASIPEFLERFAGIIENNQREDKNPDPGLRFSWRILGLHKELCEILAKAFARKAAGDKAAETLASDAASFARLHEWELRDVLDVWLFADIVKKAAAVAEPRFN
jgi:hypothetical protein